MDRYVFAMGLSRIIFAFLNLGAAVLIWKLNDAASGIKINALFGGIMGPAVFLIVGALGVAGMSKRMPPENYLMIIAGTILILLGTRR